MSCGVDRSHDAVRCGSGSFLRSYEHCSFPVLRPRPCFHHSCASRIRLSTRRPGSVLPFACDVPLFVQRSMETTLHYWRWTWGFRSDTALCIVLRSILFMPLTLRKELLNIARVQSPPIKGSYLWKRMQSSLYEYVQIPSTIDYKTERTSYIAITFEEFLLTYSSSYTSVVPASIVALAARVCPGITESDYSTALMDSLSKEVTASINKFHGATINFECVFGSSIRCRYLPFTNRLDPDPLVSADTFSHLCVVRQMLNNRILIPSIGTKTVGTRVAHNFWDEYTRHGCTFKHEPIDTSESVTTKDCHRLYLETGGWVAGPVELRHTWKYAQIGPRVYFARGGDVIPASHVIQEIVNMVIDQFPETHRFNRFSPPKDPLATDDVEVIYDYSAFTSTLEPVVEFVRWLSIFFRGITVTYVDVRDGPVPIDVGDLFERYNTVCNDYASFDIERAFGGRLGDPDPILQHTCGMLGVEGNIFLATLLHGIHLRFIAGIDRSRCVGDDARFHFKSGDGKMTESNRTDIAFMLSGIGDINLEKMADFEVESDPAMHVFRYVKRPLHRDHEIMIEGVMIDLPSLIPLCYSGDKFHDIHSSTHPCRSTFRSIIRLLRVLMKHHINLETDEDGITLLSRHCHYLTARMKVMDPEFKHAPHARSNLNTRYQLPPVDLWGRLEYEDWLIDTLNSDEVIRFLARSATADGEEVCDGRVGSMMERPGTKARSMLEAMGYVERTEIFEEFSIGDIGVDLMKEYLSGMYIPRYSYKVVRTIPVWWSSIPGAL